MRAFAKTRKDYLRLLSLTKTIIINNISKTNKKKIVKTFFAIRQFDKSIIFTIVNKYSFLIFVNSTIDDLSKTKLAFATAFKHEKTLRNFLDEESYILVQKITKDESI